jgi:hypothetical protein
VHVAGAKGAVLQIAELVEHEQRVIAGAAEMAVVGCALLLSVGRADRAIHVEHDELRRITVMNPVDPDARQIRKDGEVLVDRHQLGLEPSHLAGRCAAAFDRLAADEPPHRGITPEPVGVVHVLVSGEPSKTDWRRRPTAPCQPFLPVRLSARTSPASAVRPKASSSSR